MAVCANPALARMRLCARRARTAGKAGRIPPFRPEKLGAYLREFIALIAELRLSHARCTAISARAVSTCASTSIWRPKRACASIASSSNDAADIVLEFGGSLSGEHGDGQARGALLPKMFGHRTDAGVSRVQGTVGSGKSHEPGQDDRSRYARLRSGRKSSPRRRATRPRGRRHGLQFPDDQGSFAKRRCAASASARAARRAAAQCAPATWQHAKSSTPRAVARTCCGR